LSDRCHALNLLITERKLGKFKVYFLCMVAHYGQQTFLCVFYGEKVRGIT